MTRVELARKIRENINDAGVTYYTLEDIYNSIQDGYEEVIVYCECLDGEIELSFAANTTYYDFTKLIPSYYRTTKIWNGNTGQFMTISSDRYEDQFRTDWELTAANPRSAMLVGSSLVGFIGRTANPTGSFKVFYKKTDPGLEDDTTILIHPTYIVLLENYATADLLEQNQEFAKASRYWAMYDVMLEEYRTKIQLLSRSDRIYTRDLFNCPY